MLHEVVIGAIGSVIGAILWAVLGKVCAYFRFYKDSEYSGEWEDIIPQKEDGSPEKRDVYVLKHNKRTNTFSGSIKRVLPISQGARTWEINGVINHGYFIASFWHDGPQKSSGCIYAKLTADNQYEGYYLEEHNGIIDRTPITLKKK